MMSPDSIYKKHIETFLVIEKQRRGPIFDLKKSQGKEKEGAERTDR
jgi:hypothetical protein